MMSASDSWNASLPYESLSVFREPFCLIENDSDGKLKICEMVLNELKQIRSPINVIAITGSYRTGKSHLLNYLAGKRRGFPLGSSIRAKTKGIWVWCKPHPKREDEVLLLLDTEGLGDAKKGDEENDNWIFVLAVLLSSTLVYNSLSTIGQEGITKLNHVAELTQMMKTRETSTNEDGGEFFKFFPNFVWVVRDFYLELEDEEGNPMTADGYLEDALKDKEGTSPKLDEYNKPRQCIRQFFDDKKCFLLPMPVEGKENLKQLEQLSDSQLQPTFKEESENFCRYIFTRSFPKTAKGQPIHGAMFCHLLEAYLHDIQSGKIPCVENAFTIMAEKVNAEAVKVSFNLYEAKMKDLCQKPIDTDKELSKTHLECSEKALDIFFSMSRLDARQTSQTQLKEMIGRKYNEICNQWESDHAGSEIVIDDPEKKRKQQLTEIEEARQHSSKLQKKLEQEKINSIKEIERKQQQRETELKKIEKNAGQIPKTLSEQAECLALERSKAENNLKFIKQGGTSFAKVLFVTQSTCNYAIMGAMYGSEVGLLTANPVSLVVTTAGGALIGGACGLAMGLIPTFAGWW